MKVNVAFREEYEASDRATIQGGSIEGIAAGLAISLPASYAAHRYWPGYRALPPHLLPSGWKSSSSALPGSIQTERRGVESRRGTQLVSSINVSDVLNRSAG